MKRFSLLLLSLLCLTMLFGCAEGTTENTVDAEKVLTAVVEKIDWEELKGYAEKGADALTEKYPALKTLTDQEKMQQILKDTGLKLLGKYLESTDPEVQENAGKLGAILKILNPELTDEVNAVLGE